MKEFYDPDGFERIAEVEDRHFWFVERNRLICWALMKYFPLAGSFAEVGCGTGVVLGAIERKFPELKLIGLDYFPEALAIARRRLRRTELQLGNILDLPFSGELDAIGSFDVLEHIPDDRAALANIRKSLKPGGGLILTVPQHRFLWSVADEIGHHQRRYSRAELAGKVEAAGFRILRLTSFVSLLLPALWLSRRNAASYKDAWAELQIGQTCNALLGAILKCERSLIRSGLSLPMGGSLLLIAERA
jgi:SAM-dependent methyltransferase